MKKLVRYVARYVALENFARSFSENRGFVRGGGLFYRNRCNHEICYFLNIPIEGVLFSKFSHTSDRIGDSTHEALPVHPQGSVS